MREPPGLGMPRESVGPQQWHLEAARQKVPKHGNKDKEGPSKGGVRTSMTENVFPPTVGGPSHRARTHTYTYTRHRAQNDLFKDLVIKLIWPIGTAGPQCARPWAVSTI